MRSPLSSRTNSRPERVTPDEVFALVGSSRVMAFPSVSQLLSLACLRWPPFDPHVPLARVKPGKSRQIAANEKADSRASDQGRRRAHGAREAQLAELNSEPMPGMVPTSLNVAYSEIERK